MTEKSFCQLCTLCETRTDAHLRRKLQDVRICISSCLASGWLLTCMTYNLAPNSFLQFDVLPRRLHWTETASIVEVLCCLADPS